MSISMTKSQCPMLVRCDCFFFNSIESCTVATGCVGGGRFPYFDPGTGPRDECERTDCSCQHGVKIGLVFCVRVKLRKPPLTLPCTSQVHPLARRWFEDDVGLDVPTPAGRAAILAHHAKELPLAYVPNGCVEVFPRVVLKCLLICQYSFTLCFYFCVLTRPCPSLIAG
jgi:hypothetical protein